MPISCIVVIFIKNHLGKPNGSLTRWKYSSVTSKSAVTLKQYIPVQADGCLCLSRFAIEENIQKMLNITNTELIQQLNMWNMLAFSLYPLFMYLLKCEYVRWNALYVLIIPLLTLYYLFSWSWSEKITFNGNKNIRMLVKWLIL